MSELIDHARLGQGKRALQQMLAQQPDMLGVEPIEAPHGGDASIEVGLHHGRSLAGV